MFRGIISKRFVIITILTILMNSTFSMSVYAQGSSLYNNTNGLVTSNINGACQSTDGYIWMAQYEGLTRYDGDEFQVFNHIKIDDKNVNLEQVTCVEPDSRNGLYIGTKKLGAIFKNEGTYTQLTKSKGMNVVVLDCIESGEFRRIVDKELDGR